jgi:hypothetical protein
MVRTKRETATKGSRQEVELESGGDGDAMSVASADESLHARQQSAFAKVMGDALIGNVSSAHFCMRESNKAEQAIASATPLSGFSQATAWAAEPEWEGEASEELAETAAGSWEPED